VKGNLAATIHFGLDELTLRAWAIGLTGWLLVLLWNVLRVMAWWFGIRLRRVDRCPINSLSKTRTPTFEVHKKHKN
jgi:hypothetical protein